MSTFTGTVRLPFMARQGGFDAGLATRACADHKLASDAAAGLQIGVVRDAAALAGLASEWNTLFQRAGRPSHVFQTHAFASLYAATYQLGAPRAASDRQLAIVTARRDGRLVMVWPMLESRRLGMRCLSWLGEPVAQYGDVLLDPAEPVLATLQAAFATIRDEIRPDMIRLRKVRADAVVAPFLAHLGIAPANLVEAPCVTLSAGGSAFEDRQNGKARKNRRRLMRRLEETGSVVFREVPPGRQTSAALAAALADKREWLTRRGLVSPAFGDPQFDTFLERAAADPEQATGCAVFELSLDGRPAAVALGFRCKRRLMLHMITYAHDLEKHGAGVLNLEAILRLAEAEGLEAVDLLPPKAEYKLDWADVSVAVGDYLLGLSAPGKLACRFVDGAALPAVKTAFERLPVSLRRRLAVHMIARTADA